LDNLSVIGTTTRVLLVEDNPDDAYLIRRLLTRFSFTTFDLQVASRLQEGLSILNADAFDIVLLDLNVPDSFGLDTLLTAQANAPHVPIVVMTSLTDEGLGIRAVQLGAQDYLVKGEVDSNLLYRAISYAIERKQVEQELRRHRDHLEELVAERTTELVQINSQLEAEIIERQQAEAAERAQRQFSEALRDISNALNSSHDLAEVLDRVLANIERVVPFDLAEVMLFEEGIARIVRAHGYDETALDRLLGMRLELSQMTHLRHMSETREPVLLSDILNCPDEITIIQDSTWRAYIGIPIYHLEEVIGCISLMSFEPDFFTTVQVDHLQAFAEQAAIAIQNARFYEQAQVLAAIQERERLARDLHDAVSQALFSATMITESLPRQWERSPQKVMPLLTELHRLIRGALAEMRTLLLELRPKALLDASFSDLMIQLTEAIQSRRRIQIEVLIDEETPMMPDVKVALYRIAQESLNNIAKHTRAEHASVVLHSKPHHIDLTITDDGDGFDPTQISSTSMGLGIMRERADNINATLTINTSPAAGTEILVHWSDNGS
jgi:signal transduction histidine kinase